MTKPDWAERKLMREYCIEDGEDGYRACLIPLATVAKLLRAERSRAVRVCKGNKWTNHKLHDKGELYGEAYNQACDDCSAAIRKP